MSARLAIVLLALMAPLVAARAQQNAAPEPIVRTTIDPPRVMVGQPATLRLEVLAPNYMTSPPDVPGFQLRNAVTRQLQSVNTREQQNGIDYAGVAFEFAIYPLEPGSYAITDQKLMLKYAAEPPTTREAVISLPRIEFQAFIPDAAAGLNPFLTATGLTVEQVIQRSSGELKIGDAVTRTVTIKAEGTPAMLLPPQTFAAIDGLAVYPAQPSLSDHTDRRTDMLTSTRVESATYMLERPGAYLLPAIAVRWWKSDEQKIEVAHLGAVPLQVVANPAQASSSGGAATSRRNWDMLIGLTADHWLLAVITLAAIAGLAWMAPRVVGTIAAGYRQRRAAYLQSEAWSFAQFRSAARRGRVKAAYFALLDWLQRFAPAAPPHSLESLKKAAGDPALDHDIGSIERQLFAPDGDASHCSPVQLMRRVSIARRRLQRQVSQAETARPLPRQLNPNADPISAVGRLRPPAR